MYFCLINCFAVFSKTGDTGIGIDDLYVGIAVIGGIFIYKQKILAGYTMILDPVARQNAVLHTVVTHEQMPPTFLNPVAGIIKEIINIKF